MPAALSKELAESLPFPLSSRANWHQLVLPFGQHGILFGGRQCGQQTSSSRYGTALVHQSMLRDPLPLGSGGAVPWHRWVRPPCPSAGLGGPCPGATSSSFVPQALFIFQKQKMRLPSVSPSMACHCGNASDLSSRRGPWEPSKWSILY